MSTMMQNKKAGVTFDRKAVWGELESSSDRAAAIVGEAILEGSLSELLSSYLIENQKVVAHLLDHPGPLWSFSVKSSLAYCLGLITKQQLDDFRTINKMRNHFAHKLHGATFNDPSIKQTVAQLEPYKRFLTSDKIDSPRMQFNAAVSILAYSLSNEAMRLEHRQEMQSPNVEDALSSMRLF